MNNQSENIADLAAALAKCQSELKPVPKATKGHFKGGYADLTDCWENCRDALTKNGLSITQTIDMGSVFNVNGTGLFMITTLFHSSGQWIKSTMPIICKTPDDIQKIGSSVTYTRRYMLCSLVGITPIEDDDGNEGKASFQQPQKLPSITRDQFEELNSILQDCPRDYINHVLSNLAALNPPVKRFEDIPTNYFEAIKAEALRVRDSAKKKEAQ
jgi:ERF superfamily protein